MLDFFNILTMAGGLAFFLYGMQMLGEGLSKASGGRMEQILERLTLGKGRAVLFGAVVTALIQSSSATTVMVVGFVNSGIMKLSQAVGIIMGANIGTTVTSWVLSLSGIESENFFVRLLKPSSFAPILALIGVVLLLFSKMERRKNVAIILIGFAILMSGMDIMSAAVKPLADVPEFRNILLLFSNPVLGVLAGICLTAIIQSSSASIGILQALCATGSVTYETAVPIIMGQNIGTCVTALLSAVGASRNARRAAVVHLYFNVAGTAAFMVLFYGLHTIRRFPFLNQVAVPYGIAVTHSVFNLFATALLLPFDKGLEKLAYLSVREEHEESLQYGAEEKRGKQPHLGGGKDSGNLPLSRRVETDIRMLDSRFINNPALAMEQCRRVTLHMAVTVKEAYLCTIGLLHHFDWKQVEDIKAMEGDSDRYEDEIGTYLLRLSGKRLSEKDSRTMLLFLECIGDFERIADHAVDIAEALTKMQEKKKEFSDKAKVELDIFARAVANIMELTLEAFDKEDSTLGGETESLLRVITELSAEVRRRHIKRLRKGKCTIELGFLLSDIVTGCERIAAHCSRIVVSVTEIQGDSFGTHGYREMLRQNESDEMEQFYHTLKGKYVLP